jgi:uncharacterized protein YecE (DUF72 family)
MIRFGTSSWSEESWVGPFYPEGTKPGDFLGHYATQFDTVEADSTYYRVPGKAMVAGWAKKTPKHFVLCAKFPRSIVHGGEEATPDPKKILDPQNPDVGRFFDAMSALGDKRGPLVLQFPYFNKQTFESAEPFFERLDSFLGSLPKEFRYGVEIRNKNWLGKDLTAILKKHRTGLVLVEINYMPHPADWKCGLVTTDFAYARLIGDRKAIEAKTQTWDKIVVDQSASLKKWAGLLSAGLRDVPTVYVFANNHYAGHGPATIRELQSILTRPIHEKDGPAQRLHITPS